MPTPLKAYKTSLEVVNYVESLLIKRINKKLPFIAFPISFPKKMESLPFGIHKIYNWLSKQAFWFFQILLKPVVFIAYGLGTSIKKYYIVFTIIFLIFFFLVRVVLIDVFKNIDGFSFSNEIAYNILFSIFLIIVLFSKIPPHGEKENNLIESLTNKLLSYNLHEIQLKLVSENIIIYKDYFDKRIIFINSIFAFGWASYLLVFRNIHSYLPKESSNVLETFKLISESFLYYIIIFAFIRAYTKVYRFIFELIKISLNEVLFIQIKNET
ncbi:hypothetical protein M601_021285 [Cellulophaga baltica 4]|nr:hypothetical protein M601_021285 [Cellulophaga baltica 4]